MNGMSNSFNSNTSFVERIRMWWEEASQEDWQHSFRRGLLGMLIGAGLLLFLGGGLALAAYTYVAAKLPSPEELGARANTFESTRIYDRNGELLWEVFDPNGGRRTVVPLEEIPESVREATIATEDPTFYANPGFNPLSIARALYMNVREGEIVSGASTITQQLVKNSFLTTEVTVQRKIKEAVLATEITRRYSKDEILELYLNQNYYGNLAYGIGTAAEVYFGKPVSELTLAEATMLAGIPQGPAIYDPYTNLEAAKLRQATVLDLMARRGYLTPEQAKAVLAEPLDFKPPRIDMKAPHMVVYVRELLEEEYGVDRVYRGGLQVYTTLDLRLQEIAEQVVRERMASLAELNATNAALLAVDPHNGQILAMVGSADFWNEKIDGQVNETIRLQQPGSSIKPITYVTAFERGWSPATMIMDIKTEFPDGANPPYVPHNHDKKERGPVSVRNALAGSLNIPAVKTLQFITLPGMLEMAHRLGIESLNRPDYGLSLTLGGGDVTLLEMAGAYAAFANGGRLCKPTPFLRVETSDGTILKEAPQEPGPQVLDPALAYLITSILSDKQARLGTFAPNNALELSRPAAAKTGTTDDYRDAWTIGYTPSLVTGVWVGNADDTPMTAIYGSRGAAPIWHDFMELALEDTPVEEFVRPPGVVEAEVCRLSGKLKSDKCPGGYTEVFATSNVPKEPCDMHVDVRICSASGQRAGEFCPEGTIRLEYFEVYPPDSRAWAEAQGKPQPPADTCTLHSRGPRVEIQSPRDSAMVEGVVPVFGSARMDDFSHYAVQYGIGDNPLGWGEVARKDFPLEDGVLAAWDTRSRSNGVYSLRVVVFDRQGNQAASPAVRVTVNNPEPTITPTPTQTTTPTITPTPTITLQPTATTTPSTTPTPRASETPTRAPSSTPTTRPTKEPTHTPVPPTNTPQAKPSETPRHSWGEATETPEAGDSGTSPTAGVTAAASESLAGEATPER